jgi:hypothetical protein
MPLRSRRLISPLAHATWMSGRMCSTQAVSAIEAESDQPFGEVTVRQLQRLDHLRDVTLGRDSWAKAARA